MDLETETRALDLFERSLAIPAARRGQWIESQLGQDQALAMALHQLINADKSHSDALDVALTQCVRKSWAGLLQ